MPSLAIDGGKPVRESLLPYGRQCISDEDIAAVVGVLKGEWLTTGPKIAEFEESFSRVVGSKYAIAVSNGTAALHAATHALNIGPGDEVIVPAMTFAASANCILYQGAKPIFVDVATDTLLIDLDEVEAKVTENSKAILAVDYAGQPCDYDGLRSISERYGLAIIADACHALGGSYKSRSVGSLADLNVFSLHPVKHITTGEGGVIATNDSELSRRMAIFRNHGITSDHRQRAAEGSWFYEMVDLGYNYRLTDFQCALGISQLRNLVSWVSRRQAIARKYDSALAGIPEVEPLKVRETVSHAYHLYVVRLYLKRLQVSRSRVFSALRAEGIGVNVHYIPVHLHPFYRENFGTGPGMCPEAETAYEEIISLPIYPAMDDKDVDDVLDAMSKVIKVYRR